MFSSSRYLPDASPDKSISVDSSFHLNSQTQPTSKPNIESHSIVICWPICTRRQLLCLLTPIPHLVRRTHLYIPILVFRRRQVIDYIMFCALNDNQRADEGWANSKTKHPLPLHRESLHVHLEPNIVYRPQVTNEWKSPLSRSVLVIGVKW